MPKIVDGAHQARAEQVLPDAIYHHAGCERIGGADDPLGQFQPTAARGERIDGRGPGFKISPRHRIAGPFGGWLNRWVERL